MGWQIAIAAASAVFGGFNAYDEYHANRQIRRDLEKIQKYLLGIDRKVDEVLVLNRAIISLLDNLPNEFRQIVNEVVDEALLRERYSVIRDVRDNFLILRGGRSYRISSQSWRTFSEAMQYLFEYEHRLSKTFELISVCEIALAITKERSLPLVIHRAKNKRFSINELKNEVLGEVDTKLVTLKSLLDNKTYIRSHNLSEDLGDINELAFEAMPNRNLTQYYNERVCETRDVGRHGIPRQVCRDVRRSRQVPDNAFHNARDSHISKIKMLISQLQKLLARLLELNGVIATYDVYIGRISSESKILIDGYLSHQSLVMENDKGNDEVDVLGLYEEVEVENDILPPSVENDDEFDDYIDGCHGECDSIEAKFIQEDNKHFVLEKLLHCDH